MKASPPDEELPSGNKKPLPRWLVAVVILATGGITAAAMSMTGMRGPALAWDRANQSIENAWSGSDAPPDDSPQLTGAPAPRAGAALPAAVAPRVPIIVAGAPMTHADRGVCSNCHSVVSQQGAPVPAIQSLSTMPHEYRGVCANCHQMTLGALANAGSPVAAIQVPARPPPKLKQLTEAEWQGLEVAPSAQGVLVAGAEGAAQRAGLQAGDVVTSVNAIQTRTVADFAKVTDNGALAQGTVIVRRSAQRFAFELGAASTAQPVGAVGGATPAVPAAAKQEAQF